MAKIKDFVCPRADWKRVVNAARMTVGKEPIDKEPSDQFKRKILLAEHSPIRLLEYDVTIEDIQQWITVHIARHHVGIEKFIHSQRIDRNDAVKNLAEKMFESLKTTVVGLDSIRDAVPQGLRNNMMLSLNAQAFMSISRKRLCKGCPSKETREVWELIVEYLSTIDSILAEKCVPECVYRGFCPETDDCCGYVNSQKYKEHLAMYRRVNW